MTIEIFPIFTRKITIPVSCLKRPNQCSKQHQIQLDLMEIRRIMECDVHIHEVTTHLSLRNWMRIANIYLVEWPGSSEAKCSVRRKCSSRKAYICSTHVPSGALYIHL